jgi:hypothetical protein
MNPSVLARKSMWKLSVILILLLGILMLTTCQAVEGSVLHSEESGDVPLPAEAAVPSDPALRTAEPPSPPPETVSPESSHPAVPGTDEPEDASPADVSDALDWMKLPVIPAISEHALEIYARGIAAGHDPRAFSKVGDCQNVPSMFLSIFDHPGFYTLGEPYEYLQTTIEWFKGSFSRESQAVRRGFNAASVVSPLWADPEFCEQGETPLQCEIRLHNPSIAIVSLETWWAGKPENYEKYVRQIIEGLIDQGVLPILATKADNLEGDHSINQILVRLAMEYDIPLWNFWAAVQPLPHHGLSEDQFHLTFDVNEFDDPEVMKSAWPWRNLTALQSLDAVRRAVLQP